MKTNPNSSSEQKIALKTYVKLVRATETLNSRLKAHILKIGLTESQFGVLEALYHLGPLYQKDLAKKILKSGGNVTLVVQNLRKRGLISRHQDSLDKRYLEISLTDKGKDFISTYIPDYFLRIQENLKMLSEDEHLELQRLCKKIGVETSSD